MKKAYRNIYAFSIVEVLATKATNQQTNQPSNKTLTNTYIQGMDLFPTNQLIILFTKIFII